MYTDDVLSFYELKKKHSRLQIAVVPEERKQNQLGRAVKRL